tara:strand:- start:1603 stop:6153 length:4551 start_codon:yes stop_codon:yes gene_type:complete
MSELDKIDWGSIEISTYDPTEVTTAEKMEFGARAETTFTGNLARYAEASYDYMTKPDLTFGEALGNIESTRMREVYQEMPEFFGIQPEQEDAAIIGGRVATAFVDPITWAVPWTKVAAAGKLASAATGASFAVADSAARDYMTTGEVSGFNTGVSTVIGGGAGALSGYLARNIRFADDVEPKKLESTLEAPEAITADELDDVKKAAAKAVDPQKVKKATEETPVMTSSTQPINEARKALALLQKEKDALPEKDQGPIDAKIEDMKVKLQATRDEYFINQRDTYLDKQDVNMTMLEGLSAEGKLTEGIMAKILYETTRPVVGGLGGFALSGIVGDEDDYGLTVGMTLAGAGLGTWQSLLRRSKLTSIEKETGLLMVNKYASNNAATSAKRLFAGTLSTKLDAMGGYAKMVGNMLFQRQGASTDAVEARAIRETRKFNTTVNTILGDSFGDMNVRQLVGQIINDFNVDDIRVGYRGLNGTLKPVTAEQIEVARQAAPKLLNHQEMLSNSLREVGIDFKKLDEYGMAQTYNMAAIRSDVAGFDETLMEAVRLQNPKATEKQINKIFTDLRNNITGKRSYNKNTTYTAENVFNKDNEFQPLLDHFDKKRMITDFEARKLLAEKGFINLDVSEVFSTYSDRAIKGREFAATFGPKGEFLGEVFKKLDASFSGSDRVDFGTDYKKEILDGIDAYWGVYGVGDYNQVGRTFMSTLTTAANTTYLTRVSIASLGDMIQPFQNSGFGAAARSILRKINPNEVSFSTQSNFKYDNAFEKELTALLAASGDSLSSYQAGLNYINKKFFSWVQLERITKAARGFAYDTGINRAFTLASKKKLSKSNRAEAKTMGLTSQDIGVLKQYKNAQQAFNSEEGLEILDRIGQKVADRDAIVPMVGNRLLFAQSKNPYVRSFGQFLSWSQAKTSQINSLVERVENGDTALALRTLGLTSIYGAVQGLREVASPSYDPNEDAVDLYDTQDLTQLTKRSLALSGNYTPWQIDKLTQTGMSLVTQGKLLDEASPSISYALDLFKELGKMGANIAAGDTEGAVVNVAAITPFGKEVLSYGERLDLFQELEDRTNREKGGVITDVPNVPEEPDQRIDKMTGQPYDKQAGTAFVDEEDPIRRLGFGDGGYIDPMQRLGFGLGSLVARQAGKFLDKADDVIPPSSSMGMPTTSNMKGTTEEFDDLTKAIDKGETPKMFEGVLPVQNDSSEKSLKEFIDPSDVKDSARSPENEFGNIAANMTEEDISKWQEVNKLPESKRQKQRPEIIQSLQKVLAGNKSIEEHNKLTDEVFPPSLYTKDNAPEFPTLVEVRGAVGKKTLTGGRGIIGSDVNVEEGRRVSSRLDIPAYDQRGVWAVTLHELGKGGKAFAYGQSAILKNVDFTTDPKAALDIALGQAKGTIARIEGDWVNHNPIETYQQALNLLESDEWVQVGMNPYKHSYFYDKATMKPVKSASEVIQVGPLVLARKDKGLVYADVEDFNVDLSPESIKGKKKLKDNDINIKSVSFNSGGKVLNVLKRKQNV